MVIYVVEPNDTIYDISNEFGVPVKKLILDNQLDNPNQLIPGQTIVIVYPKETYTVQDGDTLQSISISFDISIMQLLRNNPFLYDGALYPGEVITISYDTLGTLTTNGFTYSYINPDILKKTLPSLTYLTVYNYQALKTGEIVTYFDDSNLIETAKKYGTIPLMMLTSFSLQGEPSPETAESILSNTIYQNIFIENIIKIAKNKGYLGINFYFDYLNESNQEQHLQFAMNIKKNLDREGLIFYATINPYVENGNKNINYNVIGDYAENITFIQFIWGINYNPPAPTNSIYKIESFIDHVIQSIPPNKLSLGYSLISYDWKLPYIPGITYANSLSIQSALNLALTTSSFIQFDEQSQSPFFTYAYAEAESHIVQSVDARSIDALDNLIYKLQLNGGGFWNIMFYYAQLWLVINSQYEVVKSLPVNDNFK